MNYFRTADEAAARLGLSLLHRSDADSRALVRRDRLAAYATDPVQSAQAWARVREEQRKQGAESRFLWLTGPYGGMEQLPWAVGFAEQLARSGDQVLLAGPEIPSLLPAHPGARSQGIPGAVRERLAGLLSQDHVAVATDLEGVRILAPHRVPMPPTDAAADAASTFLLWVQSLPEELGTRLPLPDAFDGVIFVASFRDHTPFELEACTRQLRTAGHPVLGLLAIGPREAGESEPVSVRSLGRRSIRPSSIWDDSLPAREDEERRSRIAEPSRRPDRLVGDRAQSDGPAGASTGTSGGGAPGAGGRRSGDASGRSGSRAGEAISGSVTETSWAHLASSGPEPGRSGSAVATTRPPGGSSGPGAEEERSEPGEEARRLLDRLIPTTAERPGPAVGSSFPSRTREGRPESASGFPGEESAGRRAGAGRLPDGSGDPRRAAASPGRREAPTDLPTDSAGRPPGTRDEGARSSGGVFSALAAHARADSPPASSPTRGGSPPAETHGARRPDGDPRAPSSPRRAAPRTDPPSSVESTSGDAPPAFRTPAPQDPEATSETPPASRAPASPGLPETTSPPSPETVPPASRAAASADFPGATPPVSRAAASPDFRGATPQPTSEVTPPAFPGPTAQPTSETSPASPATPPHPTSGATPQPTSETSPASSEATPQPTSEARTVPLIGLWEREHRRGRSVRRAVRAAFTVLFVLLVAAAIYWFGTGHTVTELKELFSTERSPTAGQAATVVPAEAQAAGLGSSVVDRGAGDEVGGFLPDIPAGEPDKEPGSNEEPGPNDVAGESIGSDRAEREGTAVDAPEPLAQIPGRAPVDREPDLSDPKAITSVDPDGIAVSDASVRVRGLSQPVDAAGTEAVAERDRFDPVADAWIAARLPSSRRESAVGEPSAERAGPVMTPGHEAELDPVRFPSSRSPGVDITPPVPSGAETARVTETAVPRRTPAENAVFDDDNAEGTASGSNAKPAGRPDSDPSVAAIESEAVASAAVAQTAVAQIEDAPAEDAATQTPAATLAPKSAATQTPAATLTPKSAATQTPAATLTPKSAATQTSAATLTPKSAATQTPAATPTSPATRTSTSTESAGPDQTHETEEAQKEPAVDTSWVVHLSSLKREEDAETDIARYQKLGIEARAVYVEVPDRGPWYRVVAGRFTSFVEARRRALQLSEQLALEAVHVIGRGGFDAPVPIPIPAKNDGPAKTSPEESSDEESSSRSDQASDTKTN